MALDPGTDLGPYKIQSALGAGGMGEVYKARDTRLDRIVAIKVLRAHLADDPDRRARFEREARLVSQLNHPNICTLHDVGQADGTDYLVVEYLDGQTLAARLERGALPLEQALSYAIQIAGALEAAHRQGIVHRDLKPANVMLTKTGAKLLDFGIAKATAAALVAAPTATLTAEGVLVGTPQYIAPEQLEGRDADARSDLFAFGAVLYEMLAGRRAFSGDSPSKVIAAILDSEPPPITTGQPTPLALERLWQGCLAKNPEDRWQSAGDVRRQLEWIAADARSNATSGQRPASNARAAWAIAAVPALVVLAAGAALLWYVGRRTPVPAALRVIRTTVATPNAAAPSLNAGRNVAITPDGTTVVYIGNKGTQLFVRPLDRLDSTAIFTGALPLNEVFISPDSQWVGFGEGNTLRKIAITGGPAQTIVPGIAGYGATWAPDDTIIFPTVDTITGLQRVSAGGGAVSMLTQPDAARGELAHVWPELLPGGRAVLFTITATNGGLDTAQVAVLDLATRAYRVLVRGGSDAHYIPSGHLVYVKGSTLVAVPFDLVRLEIHGTPAQVLSHLAITPIGSGHFDAAADGTLAYVDADTTDAVAARARTLVWVDREGHEDPLSPSLAAHPYLQPRLSPDGKLVAVGIDDREPGVWLWDITGRRLRRLTSGSESAFFFQIWTMDSRRLLFGRGGGGLFSKPVDGIGKTDVLSNARGAGMLPSGVTPDGRVLFSLGAKDVMAMSLDTRIVEPLVQTPFDERNGVVSPDGRWLAYESKGSTGPFEIYVKSYPNVGAGGWPVSTAGGTRPLWAPNGQELFFVATDGAIMAARVDSRGSAWSAGSPVKVFKGPYETGLPASGRNYDVSSDGKRFLMVKEAPAVTQATPPQLVIVQHWTEEMKRLAPLN